MIPQTQTQTQTQAQAQAQTQTQTYTQSQNTYASAQGAQQPDALVKMHAWISDLESAFSREKGTIKRREIMCEKQKEDLGPVWSKSESESVLHAQGRVSVYTHDPTLACMLQIDSMNVYSLGKLSAQGEQKARTEQEMARTGQEKARTNQEKGSTDQRIQHMNALIASKDRIPHTDKEGYMHVDTSLEHIDESHRLGDTDDEAHERDHSGDLDKDTEGDTHTYTRSEYIHTHTDDENPGENIVGDHFEDGEHVRDSNSLGAGVAVGGEAVCACVEGLGVSVQSGHELGNDASARGRITSLGADLEEGDDEVCMYACMHVCMYV